MKLQVGVKVLLQDQNHNYLIMRRSEIMSNEAETHWDIPGGRIEPEELLEQALTREVQEETGLTLTSTPKLLAAQDIMVAAKELHVVRLTYQASASGDIAISSEHQEFTHVSREAALELPLDPYLREVLETKTTS